jgi:AhpD family alkylhydroperoxidase
MTNFNVPGKADVSATNQQLFDKLEKGLGSVPNLYAYFAKNETALADYLALQNRKNTLTGKEREVINLVVSQVNDCAYCLAAPTVVGGLQGFTPEQILEIRRADVHFDSKLDALAKFVKATVINRGKPEKTVVAELLTAGYSEANLIDIIIVIGDKTISNYLHGITGLPIDFPAAPAL